jgi:FG-GAP repeat
MLGPASSLQAATDLSVPDRIALPARAELPWRSVLAAALLSLLLATALWQGPAGERSSLAPAVRPGTSSQKRLSSLPLTAQGPVSAALGADNPAYRLSASNGGFAATSPAQHLSLRFGSSGVSLSSGAVHLGLSLRAVGYGTSLTAVARVTPSVHANRVTYARAGLSEWYVNGPLGLEQGFTISRAPSGHHPAGALTLSMALSGNAHVSLASGGQSITLSRAGATALRYSGLSALDATGRRLPAHMQIGNGTLQLRIDDSGARYPLRIDPFFQPSWKLTVSGGSKVEAFGLSVALSGDGNTALIGGSDISGGAAWVFTRSGSTWTQQAKLTGSGEIGTGEFGVSVALSGDGNTALIGGPADNGGVGAAWVFTRSGSTWTQQGGKLTGSGESPEGEFGVSVALSADGNAALIGGYRDNSFVGAAWVFTRSGSTWTQQGSKLTASGEIEKGEFGFSVALSGDGNTAVIGGRFDNGGAGAAWVFTRSGSTWTQQGSKLTASGEIVEGRFGWSVALSSDGNTALIGVVGYNGFVGAAWVFTRSGSTWTQQGSKLTGSGEIGEGRFGWSVALSGDGNTALIGGYKDNSEVGAAWVFTRSGSTWTQQGSKLTGPAEIGAGWFGWSVALSGDGNTVLIGGPFDNGGTGAAWVFTPPPPTVVTGVASSVTQASATLNATVNPNEGAVSDCHFEYGPIEFESYEFSVPCTPSPGSGNSPVAVSASVGGLSAITIYHFRVVATNPGGTSFGEDHTFKTRPNPPTVVTGVASSITQTSATLNATVNPNGSKVTLCHFEYGPTESYGSGVLCTPSPGSGNSPVAVSASVGGLSANTIYHFRIVASTLGGTSSGADQAFVTAPLEYGRCVKVAKGAGKYGISNCTALLAGGSFEWTTEIVKRKFTTKIKELTKVTLQTVKGSKVTCTGEMSTGEYTGLKTVGGVVLTLTGCELASPKAKCASSGGAAGEIVTKQLEGVLGIETLGETTAKNKIGLDLFPVGRTGPLMEFSCASTTVSVQGSVIVPVTANKMLLTVTVKAAATKGKQKPENFVGGPKDTLEESVNGGSFEQTGLTLTTTQTNEEKVEVNSVV